jgi:TonB family protein
MQFSIPALLLISCGALAAATAKAPSSNLDLTPPKLVKKVGPEYSVDARNARVQGTVILETLVTERGIAERINVISPLGFGLDEKAIAAVQSWRFEPAMRKGRPITVPVTVQVHFRLLGTYQDKKKERRRTSFNLAVNRLRRTRGQPNSAIVETLRGLVREKYPPAMHLVGKLQSTGRIPEDPTQPTAELYHFAASKDYGPAIYEVGLMHISGEGAPHDPENGMQMVKDAAVLGSTEAQFYLGTLYESGKDVEADPERARRYYRLCAAGGMTACQVRLGQMLLELPDRPERIYLQGLAWLSLASEQGASEAREIVSGEISKITEQQRSYVAQLKNQLAPKGVRR